MLNTDEYQPLLDELAAAVEARQGYVAQGVAKIDRAVDHRMLQDISARMDDLANLGCPASMVQAALHGE
jgi:hypothetical protein